MTARYSRRSKSEQKKNIRKASVILLLTFIFISFVIFYGVPLLARYASFLNNIKESSVPVDLNDTTPPPPPKLDWLPEATNQEKIDINGSSEPGSTVVLIINDKKYEVLANKGGRFSYTHNLAKGKNNIISYSKDASGNISRKSSPSIIIFDNTPPTIEIFSPENGATYYGSNNKNIEIKGKTEPKTTLSVNGQIVILNSDGNFSKSIDLSEGDNTFNIKSEDRAGNSNEISITVSYIR